MEFESFKCTVSCKVPYENRYESYEDVGMLLLPPCYSQDGTPTRLVISCHGAGGSVYTDDAQVLNQTLTKYLLANGFAVMDMAGLPAEYCQKYGIDYYNNIGSPIALDAYVAGYEKCLGMYNLKKEVLVHGASMGGISSANLVLSERIPVLAHTCFCPVLDTYEEIYLHPWSNGLPRIAMEKIYSLKAGTYDEQKISPYNPMQHPNTPAYPVPLDIWQCADDGVVSVEVTIRFADKVNNGAGVARLHLLPAGGHEPQLYGGPIKDCAGLSTFQGESLFITPAVEGVFRVFSQYR